MTKLLTENLPLLAGTSNGIKKLRELILELAVRGKLLQQDSNDEPAGELLNRVATEKARLVVSGKIKKQKTLGEIAKEERAFPLPAGWSYARLADLVNVLNGRAYKKEELLDSGTPVLRVGNLFTSNHWYYSDLALDESKYCNPGDLIFSWSASFGPFIWSGDRVIYHYHIWKLDLYAADWLDKRYLYTFLLKQTQEIKAAGHGVSMVHMTKEKMEKLVVPIPPITEQKRIVAKVDELMDLCDRLESCQADVQSSHSRLVKALLDSLIQACDTDDFVDSWQRLAEHFHILFTTESSINLLKQSLLQLAVMGKLVPQDPRDESIDAFLQRKGIKCTADILPGWAEVSLGQLGLILGGSTPSKANSAFWDGDIPWVSPKDMKRPVIHDSVDHITAKALEESSLKTVPPNSLLMVVRGMILAHSFPVALNACEVTINQDMKALVVPEEISNYMLMYLQAVKSVMVGLVDRSSHGTCKLLSEKLWTHKVHLPPLAEQLRIVAKVDQLSTFCEHLKTLLTNASLLDEQLSASLVQRALEQDSNGNDMAITQEKARTLLAAEVVQKLHCEKRMGRVKLQKVISLAEHAARLKEIQSEEERYAAGPHDPALMTQAVQGLKESGWFEELVLDDGKRYEYRPLAQSGAHRPAYEALWSAKQRQQISDLIELMRPWDTARCERVATLYSAWNDLLIEGREATEAAILQEVLHGWNESKLKYSEAQWRAELAEMHLHSFLIPTGFGKRTSGGKLTLAGIE